MKPKYLMQEAAAMLIKLGIASVVLIIVSLDMALSAGNSANMAMFFVVLAVLAVLGGYIISNVRYCRLDEKGITFFKRFQKNDFISWESITQVCDRSYGAGRGFEVYVLIFNSDYSEEPVTPGDINEESFARGFRVIRKNDIAFANYLKSYREDLKVE